MNYINKISKICYCIASVGMGMIAVGTFLAFTKNILLCELTRKIAERARELQWAIGVKPADSVHLATAEFTKVCYFATYDDPLIRKVISALGGIWNHQFGIGHPEIINYELDV